MNSTLRMHVYYVTIRCFCSVFVATLNIIHDSEPSRDESFSVSFITDLQPTLMSLSVVKASA